MPKIGRNSSTDRFSIRTERGSGRVVIQDKKTGKILALKGYGALKDEYVVRQGINLSEPIAAQAAAKAKSHRRIVKRPSRIKRRER